MPVLTCYVDEKTLQILTTFAAQSERTVEDLAESAISETALMTSLGRHWAGPNLNEDAA